MTANLVNVLVTNNITPGRRLMLERSFLSTRPTQPLNLLQVGNALLGNETNHVTVCGPATLG